MRLECKGIMSMAYVLHIQFVMKLCQEGHRNCRGM